MPRVTYIAQDGKETTLDIAEGTSVMQAAVFNGVDGIVAECGGSCMCATCHVYVREDQLALPRRCRPTRTRCSKAPPARKANSRLLPARRVAQMEGPSSTCPETQT
jgi:2Fe-2S ferredoxin